MLDFNERIIAQALIHPRKEWEVGIKDVRLATDSDLVLMPYGVQSFSVFLPILSSHGVLTGVEIARPFPSRGRSLGLCPAFPQICRSLCPKQYDAVLGGLINRSASSKLS